MTHSRPHRKRAKQQSIIRQFFLSRLILLTWTGLVLFCILLWAAPATSAENALRVGIESRNPPFSSMNDAQYTGFDKEIADALCASIKRTCVYSAHPLDVLLNNIREDKLDVLFGVSETPERLQFMDFTHEYYKTRTVYVGKAEIAGLPPEILKTKIIGARKGSVQAATLQKNWGNSTRIVLDDHESIWIKLCDGTIDLVLSNSLSAHHFLLSACGQNFEVFGECVEPDACPPLVRIGVAKGQPQLREQLNAAIAEIRFTGEFNRISRKYFPYLLD